MTDKLSEQPAKETAEMSDEAVEVATKKYFTYPYPLCDCSGLNHAKECPFTGSRYNPCEDINIGVNELYYNSMEIDEGWEPPYPSHRNKLHRMCWRFANKLRWKFILLKELLKKKDKK